MGNAVISAFKNSHKLFFCHTHILRSMGGGSIFQFWAKRLLKASASKELLKEERELIYHEIQHTMVYGLIGTVQSYPPKFNSLLTGEAPSNAPFFTEDSWCIADRAPFSIGRTTNHTENFHMKCNQAIHQCRSRKIKRGITAILEQQSKHWAGLIQSNNSPHPGYARYVSKFTSENPNCKCGWDTYLTNLFGISISCPFHTHVHVDLNSFCGKPIQPCDQIEPQIIFDSSDSNSDETPDPPDENDGAIQLAEKSNPVLNSFCPHDQANELVKFTYSLIKKVARMKPERFSNPNLILSLLISFHDLNTKEPIQNLKNEEKLEEKALIASQIYMYAFHRHGPSILALDIEHYHERERTASQKNEANDHSSSEPQRKTRLTRKKIAPLFNHKTEIL